MLLLLVVVVGGVVLALDPARVLEGLDVMMAHGGRGTVSMPWLGSLHVEAQPPAYLRAASTACCPMARPTSLPAA